jgi:hypothetical protein
VSSPNPLDAPVITMMYFIVAFLAFVSVAFRKR